LEERHAKLNRAGEQEEQYHQADGKFYKALSTFGSDRLHNFSLL
jgi:hypothetical protein